MKLTRMRKISEFYICQWEGDLDDGTYLYARIRFDRFCLGIGDSRQKAMNYAINWPHTDKFIERDELEGPFHTAQVLPHLTKSGIDCSQINPEEVEQDYLDVQF